MNDNITLEGLKALVDDYVCFIFLPKKEKQLLVGGLVYHNLNISVGSVRNTSPLSTIIEVEVGVNALLLYAVYDFKSSILNGTTLKCKIGISGSKRTTIYEVLDHLPQQDIASLENDIMAAKIKLIHK